MRKNTVKLQSEGFFLPRDRLRVDHSGLASVGDEGQRHDRLAAAGGCRQAPKIPLCHGFYGLHLEVVEVTLESKINLRQFPASILNSIW